jgi:hypothetical protein
LLFGVPGRDLAELPQTRRGRHGRHWAGTRPSVLGRRARPTIYTRPFRPIRSLLMKGFVVEHADSIADTQHVKLPTRPAFPECPHGRQASDGNHCGGRR